MKRVSLSVLFALLFVSGVQAQALDAQVSDSGALPPLGGLDASVGLDASIVDASVAAEAGAKDAGTARDAGRDAGGPLDLQLPEQDCSLAHGGNISGALPLLLALALTRRRRRA